MLNGYIWSLNFIQLVNTSYMVFNVFQIKNTFWSTYFIVSNTVFEMHPIFCGRHFFFAINFYSQDLVRHIERHISISGVEKNIIVSEKLRDAWNCVLNKMNIRWWISWESLQIWNVEKRQKKSLHLYIIINKTFWIYYWISMTPVW